MTENQTHEPQEPQEPHAPNEHRSTPQDPLPAETQVSRPRTGPIVWGVIVLAFCAYTAVQMLAPGSVDGTGFLIIATITLGLILLAVGAAVIARNARPPRR